MKMLGFTKLALPMIAALALLLALAAPVLAHTGKDTEDGVYRVTFGATPEPSVTESILRLEFRINLKADNSLVSGIQDAQAVISLDGQPLKTLAAPESPSSRRGTGWYDTDVFIVSQPAKYLVTMSFTDPGGKKYSMGFDWEVKARSELYLSGPTALEASVAELQEEVEHADQAADSASEAVESLEARVASLEQSGSSSHAPGWTSPLAILGLVAGVLALGGTGVALNRSRGRQ
jgi:hypothetical protein